MNSLRILAAAAAAMVATSAFGDSLLGKRYISVGVATDFDNLSYGAAFNGSVSSGIDWTVAGSADSSYDNVELYAASVSLTFFNDFKGDGKGFLYLSPMIGMTKADYDFGFFENSTEEFMWGVGVGYELAVSEATNVDFSAQYVDVPDVGDLGVTFGVELNHWVTESINIGAGVSYNTEVEDESYLFSARFVF